MLATLSVCAIQIVNAQVTLPASQPLGEMPKTIKAAYMVADSIGDNPYEINSFSNLDIPEEMINHLQRMSPSEITSLDEEMQMTTTDENHNELVVRIKIWFQNNHITGYLQSAPMDKTSDVTISKIFINIPVQWRCCPGHNHQQHVANSIAELTADQTQYKCTSWQMYLPPFPPMPKIMVQDGRKKKGKRIDIATASIN